MRKLPWKWIALTLVVAALIVTAHLLPVVDWLKSFNDWVGHLGPLGFVAFVAIYALATVLFVPGWPLTVGAGFTFGLVLGTVAVSLGSTIGAALAFLIARSIARKNVEAMTKKNEKFQAIDRAIGEQGWKLIFLLRLSPVIPFNVSNYVYGITAVKFWPYVLASWIGMLPGTLLYVYLGIIGKAGVEAASGGGRRSDWQWVALGVGLLATIIVTFWVPRIASDALRKSELREG
jgi:uncharacterized membrane protein YdjX (TVP38/TMEM64 family)